MARNWVLDDPRQGEIVEAMLSKLGDSYDRRKRPQVRFKDRPRLAIYRILIGPYPDRRKAFRMARVFRARHPNVVKGHTSIFVIRGIWGRSPAGRRGNLWVAVRAGWGRSVPGGSSSGKLDKHRPKRPCR